MLRRLLRCGCGIVVGFTVCAFFLSACGGGNGGDSDSVEREGYRNFLGVYVEEDLPDDLFGGALISAVSECSSASLAGVKAGDIITHVDDQPVTGSTIAEALQSVELWGDTVLTVTRGERVVYLDANLNTIRTDIDTPDDLSSNGIGTYTSFWDEETDELLNGIQVSCLYEGGPADLAGIREGDAIWAINGEPINFDTYADVSTSFSAGDVVEFTVYPLQGDDTYGEEKTVQITYEPWTDRFSDRLTIGEIRPTSDQIETIIDVEEVVIDNCNGTSERISTQSVSKEIERNVEIFVGAEFESNIDAPLFGVVSRLVDLELSGHYNVQNNDKLAITREETMAAAPGTKAAYKIQWTVVSTEGVIDVYAGGEEGTIDYVIDDVLRVSVESLPPLPCDAP